MPAAPTRPARNRTPLKLAPRLPLCDDVAAESHGTMIVHIEDSKDDADIVLYSIRKVDGAVPVVRFASGPEALEFLQQPAHGSATGKGSRGPDARVRLVLLDLKLPLMDGIEVLRRMRAEPRSAHIPVVVLSSSRDPGDVRSAYQAGANGYVCKSVDPVRSDEQMRALVAYWLHANESTS
jgi:CheY-like chemotaxis protein